MKIVCDNCSAKYQISDDKVRNKTFKIRCKKCSHVIVVRGGQPPAEEPAAEEAAAAAAGAEPDAAAPAADPDAIWHVVINRENVGPLTPAQVEAYFQSGDIDVESFTWSEGMTDWSRLGSVPQFAHLAPAPEPAAAAPAAAAAPVAAAAAAAAAAPMGVEAEDPTRQQTPASMFPSEDDDVIASNNVADPPAAAASGGMFPEEPAGPRVDTAAQLRNQRNENSVLFSLDSLAQEVESSNKAKVSNTGGSEASGLIDISALSSIGGPAAGGDDPFGPSGMAPAPLTGAAPVQPLVAPSSKSNTGVVVALVVIILLLLGGGGAAAWFLLKDDPEADKPDVAASDAPAKLSVGGPSEAEKAAAEKAAIEEAAEKLAAEKIAAEKAAAAKAAEEGAGGDDGAGEDDGGEKVASAKPKASRRARTRRSSAKPAAAKPAAPKPAARKPAARKPAAKKESTSEVDDLLGALDGSGGGSKSRAASPAAASPAPSGGDPLLPEKLTRRQILTVVKRNARSITTCKNGTDASGTVPVELVIGRAGRVTSAKVKSGPQKGTSVGACIERKVRAFRFPQFSGDPMRIVMPFAL